MREIRTITTAKDILALVEFICSHKTGLKYELCTEQEIRLEYSFPDEAPRWFVPVTIFGKEEIKYFIFDHEFCSLTVHRQYPHHSTEGSVKLADVVAWGSYFHHWIVKDNVVETRFLTIRHVNTICLPDYWVGRCYNEHQSSCPVLFLTPEDVIKGFPFRDVVKDVKTIELKVTSYNEPVWLLTEKSGKSCIIYPCALHRFYDEPNITHDFVGELRNPQKNEEFLVAHDIGGSVIYPLVAFKVKNEQELSILRYCEMKQINNSDFNDFVL